MNEPRFWTLTASFNEDTSDHNRINEAQAAIGFPLEGLVDEEAGGVVGYLHAERSDEIVSILNNWLEERS